MLSKTNSAHLTTITFSIAYSDLQQRLNLEGLSVVLSHKRYSALQHVIFEVEARCDQIVDIEDKLNTRLAYLTDKGVTIRTHPMLKA